MPDTDHIYRLHPAPQHAEAVPLVFDSPHSGLLLPQDMNSVVPEQVLKTGWDAYVDELWDCVPMHGGALLAAQFHRTYIDANRHRADIDPELLDEPWNGPLQPSAAGLRGMGLIRRYALPGMPMYARPLGVAEVERRISDYYDPYHTALGTLIDEAHARFGQVWHVNCHSMKSVGNAMNEDNGSERPDMVVSDCRGESAAPAVTALAADLLRALGYRVAINDPYQGGEIVRRYGQPADGRHSVQIEINRRLYMNEARFEKHAGFDVLKSNLAIFTAKLANYAKSQARQQKISGTI